MNGHCVHFACLLNIVSIKLDDFRYTMVNQTWALHSGMPSTVNGTL